MLQAGDSEHALPAKASLQISLALMCCRSVKELGHSVLMKTR